jgi:hypothetical protein
MGWISGQFHAIPCQIRLALPTNPAEFADFQDLHSMLRKSSSAIPEELSTKVQRGTTPRKRFWREEEMVQLEM